MTQMTQINTSLREESPIDADNAILLTVFCNVQIEAVTYGTLSVSSADKIGSDTCGLSHSPGCLRKRPKAKSDLSYEGIPSSSIWISAMALSTSAGLVPS
jgi:hypothetical protein